MNLILLSVSYFLASVLFVLGLSGLTKPKTARRGVGLAGVGMLLAVLATLLHQDIITYQWIIIGLIVGTLIGIPMGLWIPMTKMPERIALSHAFGGLAVALVGIAKYWSHLHVDGELSKFFMGAIGFEVVLGSLTFTGSLMAFGKLQGVISGKPMTFKGQNQFNFLIVVSSLVLLVYLVFHPHLSTAFFVMACLGFCLGIFLVLPIGGADMPVVICLLNSYAGLAAAAAGFALDNNVLIICGALDGGSGFLLAMLMSRAMNRSFRNVLFGAFGGEVGGDQVATQNKPILQFAPEDVMEYLQGSSSVVIVPGYGMAVAQAQHAVRELHELLEKNGTEVRYAIHPVAGRMPGHMNVLLAEANIPYEKLIEMDEINPDLPKVDACIVLGANDVVNPSARDDPKSSIYGMPIINADAARMVFVVKRSMASGFAGIDNPLFYKDNTRMVFGDAKAVLQNIVSKLKEAA
ncbi:MAG: NAD synthetase [Deltaproteobacteria bacterium RIFCSPLOWO2_12_FULL_40_28]|nr:MAG: NAD synthetase [Deltaproteobacteria bacterium RIFCSPHIGHO2_02_FULL_40_28]OGQ20796.1 MAG: NAD synthetase [Deltaproteobacteria bacterium RIFCSPHIGHO2_12_FULL_40_32]OGQ39197.1 MAG: NAD synthetase [Deltaproteobacteria bacterium RIFCSPLOWO2_02_FULL_40_36]OGQ54477.1 MAG: NAD synthetase [Deltaproteobacteria bacterium RIFCSPLOWO2_12_FULL_40_28]